MPGSLLACPPRQHSVSGLATVENHTIVSPDPHFARKLASIRSLDELQGFATYRDFTEAERQAIALRRAEIQAGRK